MEKEFNRIDLHMHTSISDGTYTPEEMLSMVTEAGMDIFSITDHDSIKASGIIPGLLKEDSPVFIPGAEFSCRDENGKYHILGYSYDPDSAPMRKLVSTGHGMRMTKLDSRLRFLKQTFGITFPEKEVIALRAMDNPGKPHLGNLMVRYGYASSKEEAITEFLNKMKSSSDYIRPETAIESILAGGGIPVLAHPAYGSGDELILGDEMEERLTRLCGFGLMGVEAFYSGFTKKIRDEMLDFADRFDLYVTAGSDCHGKNKLIEIGDTGLDEVDEIPSRLREFLGDATQRSGRK
ncbi:MAG: PHP domain-containing protein [Eubacteriaceae bacterium]|nr:PHP domain-containing protein [Eubacteriaceae bacterium]